MFEEDNVTVDAGQEDVADSPLEEETEAAEETENTADEEGQPEEGVTAEPAVPQPERPTQSAEENAKYAAARREAEAAATAERQRLEKLANSLGFQTIEAFEEAVAARERQEKLQQQIEQGIPEPIAERLMALEEESRINREREAQRQKDEVTAKQFRDLIDEYPEVRGKQWDELPDEVRARIESGETPVQAYRAYENKVLRDKIKALEQNATNKKTSIGSLKNSAPAKSGADSFVDGLFGR